MIPLTGNSGSAQASGYLAVVPPGGYSAERAARQTQRPQPVEKVHKPSFNPQSVGHQARKTGDDARPPGNSGSTALALVGTDAPGTPKTHTELANSGVGRIRSPFLAQLMAQESGANTNPHARGAMNGHYRFNPTEAYQATMVRDRRIEFLSAGARPFAAAA